MSIWTTQNGNTYMVNINSELIQSMQAVGARFCWIRDNNGIDNENDKIYFQDTTDTNGGESGRTRRENITVVCADGESITGYVTHLVKGPAAATDQIDWFIIQPGTYPTTYPTTYSMINYVNKNDVSIEEL